MRPKLLFLSLLLIGLGLSLSSGVFAQTGVTAVVVNDWSNIRIIPEIGAEVITTVPAGYYFATINGRSADNQWLRIDFNGSEGWVHTATLTVLTGDINVLPVADPRSIPYGGWGSPRSGITSATGLIIAQLTNGVHVRSGPSTGYAIVAEAFINETVSLLGRTASSAWVQINYQGTLGWITSRYLLLPPGTALSSLPVDGIIAEGPLIGDPTGEDYIATLHYLLDRLNIAQESLDTIRTYWTDAALNGRAHCDNYPARPTGYNIPRALLASHYIQLNPISILFNDAMYNVTYAINLFIDTCNQIGTINPVSQATTVGALNVVALADAQFAELRLRINALIPPPVDIGAGECIFTYAGQTAVLPVLPIGVVMKDNFTPREWVTGYCFDALQGQSLVFETRQLAGSNIVQLLAVSPFDDPTNFSATGQTRENQPGLIVGPIIMQRTTRYLLILYHTGELPPNGEFGVLIHEPIAGIIGILQLDPVTGQPIISLPAVPTGVPGVCSNIGANCSQLFSCAEAYACLAAGNFTLDSDDNDGVPCEGILCPNNP